MTFFIRFFYDILNIFAKKIFKIYIDLIIGIKNACMKILQ